jgi:hypothetical protein
MAADASTVGIAANMLQDKEGGLQLVSYWARELNPTERGNTYSVYGLESLAVYEAGEQYRCYLEGCSKFLVASNHDALRHLHMQPNNIMSKRQACYLRVAVSLLKLNASTNQF